MASTTTKKIITLDISEEETRYLRDLLQNYFGDPNDEPSSEKQIRCDLFHEMKKALAN